MSNLMYRMHAVESQLEALQRNLNELSMHYRMLKLEPEFQAMVTADREKQAEEDKAQSFAEAVWNDWGRRHKVCNAVQSLKPDQLPSTIAVQGPCVLCYEGLMSKPMNDPTWGRILKWFDRAIPKVNDFHHCFLEGIEYEHGNMYRVITGS